jgi:hypothetical protein
MSGRRHPFSVSRFVTSMISQIIERFLSVSTTFHHPQHTLFSEGGSGRGLSVLNVLRAEFLYPRP